MKSTIVALFLSLATLAVSACSKDEAEPQAKATPTESLENAKHAAAGVVPGSYEDWCEEHQVPESMCTKCNPALSAAFKATNDWCPEHGLPESQCRLCNPNLSIVRPPQKRSP